MLYKVILRNGKEILIPEAVYSDILSKSLPMNTFYTIPYLGGKKVSILIAEIAAITPYIEKKKDQAETDNAMITVDIDKLPTMTTNRTTGTLEHTPISHWSYTMTPC